jgi:hypothetical protein
MFDEKTPRLAIRRTIIRLYRSLGIDRATRRELERRVR